MKELDFDELDRAVNSLMSGVPKSAPVKNDDVKVLTLDTKLPEDAKLPISSPAALPAQTDSTSPVPSVEVSPQPEPVKSVPVRSAPQIASLAARRGGRFMDVVHPSSDMIKSTPAPAATSGISRQGLTIEPRAATPVSSEAAATVTSSTAPAEETPAPAPVTESKGSVEPVNDWPDPLDLSTSQASAADVEESDAPVSTEKEPSIDSFNPVADPLDQQGPLTSPFIADAKVEKRPLGGNPASNDPQSAEVEEPDHSPVLGVMAEDSPSDDETDNQLPPEPVEADVPLPEELRGDLMAIESDSHQLEPAAEAVPAATPASVEAPLKVKADAPTGPSSIPQQYKEEPSTGDQTSGAIFDSAAYHQPLEHPAKKNSSWLWIIGVIVILLLGAAGGAALYFYGIV